MKKTVDPKVYIYLKSFNYDSQYCGIQRATRLINWLRLFSIEKQQQFLNS